MAELKMDFAAILDHRQVRHMYLPEWDDTLFICGTEPGTSITDSHASKKSLHYNMLFSNSAELEKVLAAFPEYNFEGGPEGHFKYPPFTRERFGELMDAVRDNGGFFVIPHPRQIMETEDVMDFWYRDHSGIEVFYMDLDDKASLDNYPVWEELLQRGKKVWVCAGGDKHEHPKTGALTTIYAEEQRGSAYIPHLRCGDFTSGNAGIRMVLGDTLEISTKASASPDMNTAWCCWMTREWFSKAQSRRTPCNISPSPSPKRHAGCGRKSSMRPASCASPWGTRSGTAGYRK